ncbi:MAG: hypothetical protein ABH858_06800 [Candidatus Omnitrophota bacterium]
MRRILAVILLVGLFAGLSLVIFMGTLGQKAHARTIFIVDAQNDMCPVTGQEIPKKRFNTAYEGKRYWFLTYQAVAEFKKDPERYLRRLEQLEKSGAKSSYTPAERTTTPSYGTQEKEPDSTKKRWWQ